MENELQKLINFVWVLIENDTIEGESAPDLDYCQEELNLLIESFANKTLADVIGWKPRSKNDDES